MLSRAQEARVLKVLGMPIRHCEDVLPGTPAGAIKIPSAHAFDLVTFIQTLRAKGKCEARYGGFCDAEGMTRMISWSGGQTPRWRRVALKA